MGEKCIVVMGGSFNPPTDAHLRLMSAAMDGVGADMGVFVPSSHTYVKIKMRRMKRPKDVYSQEMRLAMLRSMCAQDERLTVNDFEYQNQNSRNYETMEYLQQQYPDSKLYFLLGADKLHIFPRWHRGREFVRNFSLIVFRRDGEDPERIIQEDDWFREVRRAFVILPQPEGTDGVSSSVVRKRLENGEDISRLVTPGVHELLMKGETT